MKPWNSCLFFLATSFGAVSIGLEAVQAQVQSDGTTGTVVQTTDNLNFAVIQGTQAQGNLFHSFGKFSVPTGGAVTFRPGPTVQTIFSRVTGNTPSSINGTVAVTGLANLFLLNPQGIVFGPDASLALSGSFLATTADRVVFAEETFFSATEATSPADSSLLSISTPVGLQFGPAPGAIVNQSVATFLGNPVGLQVQPGQTLALIGGEIQNTGILSAPGLPLGFLNSGGHVELGSVGGNAFVSVILDEVLLLNYPQEISLQDIKLIDGEIDVTGNSSGLIHLQARNIELVNFQIAAINLGDNSGGAILLNASESLLLNDSSVNTVALANGVSGNIKIHVSKLSLQSNSFIDANTLLGGSGGDIIISSNLVEIEGLSQITAQTFGAGNAGTIVINTENLVLSNIGQIASTSLGSGKGGQIEIFASNSIKIRGSQELPIIGTLDPSSILSEALETGNGGTIDIRTSALTIEDNGIISAAVRDPNGSIAGEINIAATNVSLNQGTISTAAASGAGGNIRLTLAETLDLTDSTLSATAGNNQFGGDGGNITLNSGFIVARPPTNHLTANAFTGTGGNITLFTNALLGGRFLDITASSNFGLDGSTSLTEDLNVTTGLDPLPDTPAPLPQPHRGCPNAGGEARFTHAHTTPSLPEAQHWIAQADGTIVLQRNPILTDASWFTQLADRYAQTGNLAVAKDVYQLAIDGGHKTPENYDRLLSLLFQLDPGLSQQTLEAILHTQSQKQLTELEDFLNCRNFNFTSVYDPVLKHKPDAIVTLIELAEDNTLRMIVSRPAPNGYHHHYAGAIDLEAIHVPLTVLSNALEAHNLYAVPLYDFVIDPAQELHEALIPVLKPALPSDGTLLFVLDRKLQKIPFALLQDRNDRYLIEQYNITQTSIPHIYQPEAPSRRSILAAGVSIEAPSFEAIPTGQPKPLPFVAQELAMLATLPTRHKTLHNESFTLQNLFTAASAHSVIHIAAHGRFSSLPNQTYLTAYDRLITLEDFEQFVTTRGDSPTPIELLVLSACRTAQGDDRASLGLAGIAARAGAESTIASLWAVSDQLTAIWMELFYAAWLVEGKSKVEALRYTQLEMLEEYNDPRVWAAFILVGNWA